MKRTDDEAEPGDGSETHADADERVAVDGGRVDASPLDTLETTAESPEVGLRETMVDLYEGYVFTPAAIMWSDWRARVGVTIVAFYLVVGLFGPFVVEPTRSMDGTPLLRPFQTMAHPLGTDNTGADLLSMTVYSTVPILQMMFAGGLFTVTVGTLFGTMAGYKGGVVDLVLSTVTDVFINIPGMPLVIVLATIFEPENPYLLGILLSVASWAGLARAIRSQVLTFRNEAFTEASRTMGISANTIVVKDLLPHLMTYISVNLVQAMRNVVFAAVGLYFVGVLPFRDLNWGVMLNLAYNYGAMYRMEAIHWLLVPMGAIVGLSMGMILLAQSLDRVFNPRVRAKHAKTIDTDGGESSDEPATASSWL